MNARIQGAGHRVEARVRFRGPADDEFLQTFILGRDEIRRNAYGVNVDTGWHNPQWVHAYKISAAGNQSSFSGSARVNFRDGEWHTVALELLENGDLKGFYDGSEVFVHHDLTYSEFNNLFIGTSAAGVAYDWDRITIYKGGTEVKIDIKPSSDQNSINPRSKGKIPVAILTTEDFDAWDVDSSTLAFGPDGAGIAHAQAHAEDIDGDGDLDMIAHFKTQETGISCGETEATLTGETLEGQTIVGKDSIRTVGCK